MTNTFQKVAIAFVAVDPEQNPNVKSRDVAQAAAVYQRAAQVAFSSVRRWNPTLNLEYVTNAEPPAEFGAKLGNLGVEVRLTEFEHRPPKGFSNVFAASLFMLDALRGVDQPTLFIDPDVVCLKGLGPLFNFTRGRVGVLPLDTPADEPVNGLSLHQASSIYAHLDRKVYPPHYGGEFYYVEPSHIDKTLGETQRAWADALERSAAGAPHFTTEEHILSFAFSSHDDIADLSEFAARVWTSHRHRTVRGETYGKYLWHLPSEKERGFAEVHAAVEDRTSWFWSAESDEYRRRCARAFGVRFRRRGRLARDTLGGAINAVASVRRRVTRA